MIKKKAMEEIIIDEEIITCQRTLNRPGTIRFHLSSLSILFCNRIKGHPCRVRGTCMCVCVWETFFFRKERQHNRTTKGSISGEISLRDFLGGGDLRESSGRNLNNYTLIKVATKIPFDPSGNAFRSFGDKGGREIVAITIFRATRDTRVPWSS